MTFCWLPPLRVEIGADGPALTTPRRWLHDSTSVASSLAERRPRLPRVRSADSEMFSPTENSAMTASVCRSAGTSGMSSSAARRTSYQSGEIVGQADLARGRAHRPCRRGRYGQLERAGAGKAGDAEDLARSGLEVDPAQPLAVDLASLDRQGLVDLIDHGRPGSRGRCRRRPSGSRAHASRGCRRRRCRHGARHAGR